MAAIFIVLASASAAMGDCNHPVAISFAPGQSSTTVSSGESVPTVECYQVIAPSGRDLGMYLESAAKGPSLEVYAPGWTTNCDAAGECNTSGTLMSDPGETEWIDSLTETGAYLIVIDNANGDDYRLTIEIRASGDDRS
ncbi:MAG TPA: hypothetical protein VMI30_12540 [Stellaceae bacterium]|nr:hypothetical protein [Stellaceae bacterium]